MRQGRIFHCETCSFGIRPKDWSTETCDYLEAKIVKEGMNLKPVAMVERERAWQRIADLKSQIRDLKPDPSKSDTEVEEEIAGTVKPFRRAAMKHG